MLSACLVSQYSIHDWGTRFGGRGGVVNTVGFWFSCMGGIVGGWSGRLLLLPYPHIYSCLEVSPMVVVRGESWHFCY